MRTVALMMMAALLLAAPVRAQEQANSHKLVKILIGAGALAVGTAVAARSSNSTTVTSALGTSQTSSFSTSQLVTGLAIAGVGGIVLWDGLREHRPSQPSTAFGVNVAGAARGVFVRRSW